MFYNTNQESAEELQESRSRAKTQEGMIWEYFRDNPYVELTPFEIKSVLQMRAPITSIRRAITDLTNKDVLKKTDYMRMGSWNKMTHAWRLK